MLSTTNDPQSMITREQVAGMSAEYVNVTEVSVSVPAVADE